MAVPQGLTDCKYFLDGYCFHGEDCRFRHCPQAVKKRNKVCFQWPHTCRNSSCRYLHPLPPPSAPFCKTSQQTHHQQSHKGSVSFFWDIENVHVPRAQNPSHIVERLRDKFVHAPGLLEIGFTCYVCETSEIPRSLLVKLHHANVRIAHVPDRKPGAVDRQILLDLDRFERAHTPPATIVLISSDIDYVGKLNDLRHQAGYRVIVVHNKPVREDLWTSINAHYSWDMFTNTPDIAFSDASESSHFSSSSYPCPECTNVFYSLDALHQHQDAKNHLMECPMCDCLFYTSSALAKHQETHGHYKRNFACRRCDRSFSALNQLKQHQNDSHSLSNRNGPWLWPIITDHWSSPIENDPSCPECSATFHTLLSLHQHQDAKQHTFDCPICDDTFYTSEGQEEHQESENHYLRECNICNRAFRTHESLTQHKLDKFHH